MSYNILVVDDCPLVRRHLRACLEGAGYRVLEADNGARGLGIVTREPVDLILVDVNMPVMGGLEMLRALRAVRERSSIPAFVLTSESSPDVIAQGKKHGATAWIVKPVKPEILIAGVDQVLCRAA